MSQIVLRLSPLPGRGGEHVVGADRRPGDDRPGNGRSGGEAAAVAARSPQAGPLAAWAAPVATAHDACVLVDTGGRVVSLSEPGASALGCSAHVAGRPLLDVVTLVDFETGDSHPDYAPRIPPLSALKFVTLVRGLLRVRQPDGRLVTLDAVAAPLHDAPGQVVGSVTFLAAVTPG